MNTYHISVIVTVYNESRAIERLLQSLVTQSRLPDEVVICDGGSTDNTVALIRAFMDQTKDRLPLRLLVVPGANISLGRNLAIAAAKGSIIAATDAGVRLTPHWLETLTAPWQTAVQGEEPPLAVAGFFQPDVASQPLKPDSPPALFLCAMAATVLPLREDIQPEQFLPSSRSVAFTKAVWHATGGYPEWLDYCEDLIFDFAVNAQRPLAATAFVWAPEALVYFRPRESLTAFARQYYRYARGDGKADLWRKRHLVRYLTYLVALPLLFGYALGGATASWLGWLGLLAGGIIYCARPWQRLPVIGAKLAWRARLGAAVLIPVIRVVGDIAKMAGYPVGLWWRWRNRQQDEIHWRRTLAMVKQGTKQEAKQESTHE
ncbi:MAG: glycosyltransferase [Caldilineaceae bacterium]